MAEFGTFSLKDAIAPALQLRQMQLQEAETQGVLAKLAREQELQGIYARQGRWSAPFTNPDMTTPAAPTPMMAPEGAAMEPARSLPPGTRRMAPGESAGAAPDAQGMLRELMARGFYKEARDFEKIELDMAESKLDYASKLLQTATRATWPLVRRQLMSLGAENLPARWTPQTEDLIQQQLASVNDTRENALQQAQRAWKAGEPFEMKVGDRLLTMVRDPETGALQEIANAARWSTQERTPLVTINNTEQGAEAKAVGGYFGDTYKTIQIQGVGAPTQIAKLNRLDQLLDQVDTGKFSGTMQFFKAAAKDAGIDLEALGIKDDVAPAEAAAALANEMALDLRSTAEGGGMPGAMSDSDREFLVAMTPNLAQTAEGRKLLISARKKMLERQREVARLARDYRKKNGQLDEGFFDELQTYSDANPLFSDDDMTTMETTRLPVVSSPAEAAKLPPGTRFRTPDGRTMRTASDGRGIER